MCYFNTLVDVEYNSGGGFDKRWGLYSWAGGIITAILSGIFFPTALLSGIFFPTALPFILIAFVICQLIQIVLIFKGTLPYGGVGNAFLCTAVYLLGSLASILILAHFVVLLIIVLVAYFILSIIGKTSSSEVVVEVVAIIVVDIVIIMVCISQVQIVKHVIIIDDIMTVGNIGNCMT